jgi:hypothetical protein
MKWTLLFAAGLLTACDRPAPPTPLKPKPGAESVFNVPTPENTAPPVETRAFEKGYEAGTAAGEAAVPVARAAARKGPVAKPTPESLEVLALKAAGADTARGPKWQRGFVAGYQEAFERVAEGKK